MTEMPLIVRGMVAAQNPADGSITVMVQSGQLLTAKILYSGTADAVRINQEPLPERGTYGLVCFTNGDVRNGVWLGSYYRNFQDAISAGPVMGAVATDPNAGTLKYHSHWSGYWDYLDGAGTSCQQWPDGTSFVVGASGLVPTVFRNVVDEKQARKQIAYTMKDRVATPPANPFILDLEHSSGTRAVINASGSVLVSGATTATFTDTFGQTTMSIDISGNTTVSGAAGASLTFNFGGTTMVIDPSGNVQITLAGGAVIQDTRGGAATDFLPLVSKLLTAFNSHVHAGITRGGADTDPPLVPWTPTTINSIIHKTDS